MFQILFLHVFHQTPHQLISRRIGGGCQADLHILLPLPTSKPKVEHARDTPVYMSTRLITITLTKASMHRNAHTCADTIIYKICAPKCNDGASNYENVVADDDNETTGMHNHVKNCVMTSIIQLLIMIIVVVMMNLVTVIMMMMTMKILFL
jgi:hypothetical protein